MKSVEDGASSFPASDSIPYDETTLGENKRRRAWRKLNLRPKWLAQKANKEGQSPAHAVSKISTSAPINGKPELLPQPDLGDSLSEFHVDGIAGSAAAGTDTYVYSPRLRWVLDADMQAMFRRSSVDTECWERERMDFCDRREEYLRTRRRNGYDIDNLRTLWPQQHYRSEGSLRASDGVTSYPSVQETVVAPEIPGDNATSQPPSDTAVPKVRTWYFKEHFDNDNLVTAQPVIKPVQRARRLTRLTSHSNLNISTLSSDQYDGGASPVRVSSPDDSDARSFVSDSTGLTWLGNEDDELVECVGEWNNMARKDSMIDQSAEGLPTIADQRSLLQSTTGKMSAHLQDLLTGFERPSWTWRNPKMTPVALATQPHILVNVPEKSPVKSFR